MIQNLKSNRSSRDAHRKLAFLRNRQVSTINRSHRLAEVEKMQIIDRGESLEKRGLPKWS